MTNGKPAPSVDTLREEYRRLRYQVRIQGLERSKKLLESTGLTDPFDWVGPYQDLFDQFNGMQQFPYPLSTPNDRRYGQNFPLIRNEQQLALIRAPSRILCSTNDYAIGLMEGLTSYVVSSGFTYRAISDDEGLAADMQRAIDDFIESAWWGELEQELFWRSREDGEFFLRCDHEDGETWVRTIEPEQVQQEHGTPDRFSFGIETDPKDLWRIYGYTVLYLDNPGEYEQVDASEVIHHKCNVKRTIKRGIPDFSFTTADAFRLSNKLQRNMGESAAIQAAIAYIRQHEGASLPSMTNFQAAQTDFTSTDPITGRFTATSKMAPGSVLDIGQFSKYLPPPAWGSSTPPFVDILQACLRAAGVRWNVPEWLASGLHDTSSFASSLTAESPLVKRAIREQKKYERPFMTVMRKVIRHKIDAGDLPDYALKKAHIQCEPPSLEVRNKLEEAQANQIRVQGGWKSNQTVMQEEGLDVEAELQNIEDWQERMGPPAGALPMPGDDPAGQGGDPRQQQPKGGGAPKQPRPTGESLTESDFDSGKHPRGQPDNAGQFGKGGGGKKAKSAEKKKSDSDSGGASAAPTADVKIAKTNNRAFSGKPTPTKNSLSKQDTGKIGEAIVIAYLQSNGLKDARHLNLDRNNFPIDLIQDHESIEAKAGLVSNNAKSQRWRLSIGEPGKKEKEWLKTASAEDKAAWNAQKQQQISVRKQKCLADLEKELGHKIKARTMTVLINPDTKTADLYSFEGWHDYIGWNSDAAKKAYVGSVKYG